jgi:long-chain acyl-CoA synthetase
MGEKVRIFTSGLISLGVRKGDRVALLSENRFEWPVADMGILHSGAVNVAVFPSLPVVQVKSIIDDSGAGIIIVSDKKQMDKAVTIKKSMPGLRVVIMDGESSAGHDLISFAEVMSRGEASLLGDEEYKELWRSVGTDDVASIVYTSGTTGEPKGALLTHRNFASNVMAARDVLTFNPGETLLSVVPLNHVMGRMADHYLPISCGATIAYVENIRHLKQMMQEVRPHYMVLVPRIFEVFQEGLMEKISEESSLRRRVFKWALKAGKRRSDLESEGKVTPLRFSFQSRVADRLVFSPVRKRLGLDRLKLFITGSAPLSRTTAEFFFSMGLKILEGYGLTETSPLVSINRPGRIRLGTVGHSVKGVEVRIAWDGEVLVRGPNVMKGYFNKPVETSRVIDGEGWFHTGDIGEMDDEGFIRITDRKKDILVLSNGKNVAPQPVENRLKESRYISRAVLFGNGQSAVVALIVPDFDRLKRWVRERGLSVDPGDHGAMAGNREVNELIHEEIKRLSGDLADFEKVRRFSLMDHDFTIEGDELSPILKIKRPVVMRKYRELIDSLYRV